MNTDEVTQQIMSAWDEIQEEDAQANADPGDETDAEEEQSEVEAEAAVETEEAEGEPEEEREDEEEAEEEEEETEVTAEVDPEVAAFLAKYDNDMDKALRAAADLYRVVGRQGSEKNALSQRVQELEAQLEQAQAFSPEVGFLTPEQNQWVEEAVGSGNPLIYVQRAAQEGEFGLARAVVTAWGQEQPFEALRVSQQLDALERQANTPQPQPVDTGVLLDVLAENFPEMRTYEAQMVTILNQLGPGHPLVHDARSGDVNTAARGIIGIYEIARASSASVRTAKDSLRKKHRQEADSERDNAVVSSASSSPAASETPRRSRQLMPGLTLEDLDAAFAGQ